MQNQIYSKRDVAQLGQCMDLYDWVPIDIELWIMRDSNKYHDGCEYTFIEAMDDLPGASASWKAHLDDSEIHVETTAKSGEDSFRKVREKHILSYMRKIHDSWPSWEQARRVTELRSFLLSISVGDGKGDNSDTLYVVVKTFVETSADYMNPTMKRRDTIVRNLLEFGAKIMSYRDVHNDYCLVEVYRTLLLFIVPCDELSTLCAEASSPDFEDGGFLFDKPRTDFLTMLDAPMQGSCAKRQPTKPSQSTPPSKKRRRSSIAASSSGAEAESLENLDVFTLADISLGGGGDSRPARVLDVIIRTAFLPLEGLRMLDINWDVLRRHIGMCYTSSYLVQRCESPCHQKASARPNLFTTCLRS